MTLRCERKADENADLYEAYCLRSTRSFEDGSEMWRLYTELTHPESGFRCLKTDVDLCLGSSPEGNNFRKQVFISILALHLLCYIKRKLKEGGYPALPWKTLKTLLSNHTYTTLSGSQGEKTYCLRKPGLPSEVQKKIYNIFGINIKELPRTRFEFSSPSK